MAQQREGDREESGSVSSCSSSHSECALSEADRRNVRPLSPGSSKKQQLRAGAWRALHDTEDEAQKPQSLGLGIEDYLQEKGQAYTKEAEADPAPRRRPPRWKSTSPLMRAFIPDELFKELEQLELDTVRDAARVECHKIKVLRLQLREANAKVSKMRLDYVKEVTELQNKLALAHKQPRHVLKVEGHRNRKELSANQAQLLQQLPVA